MHVNHAFLYISLPSLHHYDMKLPNFTSPLYGVGKHNHKNCRFLFLNLDNDRYCPKENFAKICQIKWSWIRSVKFEIVRIDFKVTLSVCCHPKILLPWQRDVTTSPLYSSQLRFSANHPPFLQTPTPDQQLSHSTRQKSWLTLVCRFPLPQILFGYYSRFGAPKYAWLKIAEGEGHILVRTKVQRVNVGNFRENSNGVCFEYWR